MSRQYEPADSPDETTLFEYHDLTPSTLGDVYAARQIVQRHLPRTPLVRSEALSTEFDADVYLKREDTLPTGAFKVRGGLTLASNLDEAFREAGLIAASTGNHGASVAYAGREFDVSVVIGVPEDANPDKVATMEGLGARVAFHGNDFDEAREWVERKAAQEGYRYVHSANEPELVAGVATAGLEIVEDLPKVDLLFSPVGGGSSASGYCLTVGNLTDARVIGVQSEAADAVAQAWREGHLDPHERMKQPAEGLATRVPFAEAYFPNGAGPTMQLRTCVITESSDGHFVLGSHPNYDGVHVAAGFTGHGFKFTAVVGEILADFVTDGETDHTVDLHRINRLFNT